ncbi:hypothetical protein MMC25_000584 [Agyrium rufum]|nr:hypothetical protein [Agyrium rufum]
MPPVDDVYFDALRNISKKAVDFSIKCSEIESQMLRAGEYMSLGENVALFATVLTRVVDGLNDVRHPREDEEFMRLPAYTFTEEQARKGERLISPLNDVLDDLIAIYRQDRFEENDKIDQGNPKDFDFLSMRTRFIFANGRLGELTKGLLLVNTVIEYCHYLMSPALSKAPQAPASIEGHRPFGRTMAALRPWGPELVNTVWDSMKPWYEYLAKRPGYLTKHPEFLTSGVQRMLSELNETQQSEQLQGLKNTRDKTAAERKEPVIHIRTVSSSISHEVEQSPTLQPFTITEVDIPSMTRKGFFGSVLSFLRYPSDTKFGKRSSTQSIILPSSNASLDLYTHKPFLRPIPDGFRLEWEECRQENISDPQIRRQLKADLEESLVASHGQSTIEQISKLSAHEENRIQQWLRSLPFQSIILSIVREETEISQGSLVVKGAATFRIIVERGPLRMIKKLEGSTGTIFDAVAYGGMLPAVSERPRPTWLKISLEHIEIATIEVYGLPWEYDTTDVGYVIIKAWLSETDQDILFEHTKRLRQTGLMGPSWQGRRSSVRGEGNHSGTNMKEMISDKGKSKMPAHRDKEEGELVGEEDFFTELMIQWTTFHRRAVFVPGKEDPEEDAEQQTEEDVTKKE